MSHENMVRGYVDNTTDTTTGHNIYTPESGKAFELTQMVIGFNVGATDYTIDIYDDTDGANDQVMHIVHDATRTGNGGNDNTRVYNFEGLMFGKAFRVVGSVSTGISIGICGRVW